MTARDIGAILLESLDDERKAEATYAAVIAAFGPVRPFVNIIEAERRHSTAIERQMQRLGLTIPQDRWQGQVQPPESLAAACEQGIAAEIENIALYDRLLPGISDPLVRQTLQNLQDTSRDNHLPAFRRCLAREKGQTDEIEPGNISGPGPGAGGGRRRRHRGGCSD